MSRVTQARKGRRPSHRPPHQIPHFARKWRRAYGYMTEQEQNKSLHEQLLFSVAGALLCDAFLANEINLPPEQEATTCRSLIGDGVWLVVTDVPAELREVTQFRLDALASGISVVNNRPEPAPEPAPNPNPKEP